MKGTTDLKARRANGCQRQLQQLRAWQPKDRGQFFLKKGIPKLFLKKGIAEEVDSDGSCLPAQCFPAQATRLSPAPGTGRQPEPAVNSQGALRERQLAPRPLPLLVYKGLLGRKAKE